MAFQEDPAAFLADFGVTVTDGSNPPGTGILDQPGDLISGGQVVSVEYVLTYRTSSFPNWLFGTAVTVAGVAYTVRQVTPIDDGVFSAAALQKV